MKHLLKVCDSKHHLIVTDTCVRCKLIYVKVSRHKVFNISPENNSDVKKKMRCV